MDFVTMFSFSTEQEPVIKTKELFINVNTLKPVGSNYPSHHVVNAVTELSKKSRITIIGDPSWSSKHFKDASVFIDSRWEHMFNVTGTLVSKTRPEHHKGIFIQFETERYPDWNSIIIFLDTLKW